MLQKKCHDEQGFSIIEVLVTLTVLAILLSIFIPISNNLLEKKIEEKFLETFQYDVLYVQSQSIGNPDYLRIILYPDYYEIASLEQTLLKRELPSGWKLDRRKLEYISFNEKGSIRFAGTIKITSPYETYNIIFPIGKGRGYIEKQ